MFGLLVSGRLVQTNFVNIEETRFIINLEDADSINHIVVFLTGETPFPDGYAGSVYFSWPNSDGSPPAWTYLGFLSNQKPSAIFKVSQLKDNSSTTGPFSPSSHCAHSAQIGISVEPESQIATLTPASGSQTSQLESFAEFATKMLENFSNFATSFAVKQSEMQLNPSETYVPASVVGKWFQIMNVVEFYSGIGGMHFALKEAGIEYTISRAFDINTTANQVYKHNFPDVALMGKNIMGLTVEALDKLKGNLWTMSPPCQPFTRQGKQGDVADARTQSFLHLLSLLKSMKTPPDTILLENVKGFEISDAHALLIQTLQDSGYDRIEEYLLNPLQLGMPNSRLRYYLMASRGPGPSRSLMNPEEDEEMKINKQFQQPSEDLPLCQCGRYSEREIDPQKIQDFLLETTETERTFLLEPAVLGKQAQVLDIVTPDSGRSCCFTRAYSHYMEGTGSVLYKGTDENLAACYKMADSAESPSEKASILQNLSLRFFSPREVAKLMGFPAHFSFPEALNRKQRYRVLGNSINVKVVARLLHCRFCEGQSKCKT